MGITRLKASDGSVKGQEQNSFCFIFTLKQLQCFEFTQNAHFIKHPHFFFKNEKKCMHPMFIANKRETFFLRKCKCPIKNMYNIEKYGIEF